MTRRRDRAIARRRPPALPGDFAGDEPVTELIAAEPPAWDGTTWAGASAPGQPASVAYLFGAGTAATHPMPAAPVRRALAAAGAQPQEPPASRPADCAMPVKLRDGTFGLLCGIDRWRIHSDPEAAWYRHMFDALRVSALRAGWRTDACGRWCCPRCAMDPAFWTRQPVAHWHPAVPHARAGEAPSREYWLARPATEWHEDACAAAGAGDPAAEFWLQVEAEVYVAGRTADAGRHGRHEAGAR